MCRNMGWSQRPPSCCPLVHLRSYEERHRVPAGWPDRCHVASYLHPGWSLCSLFSSMTLSLCPSGLVEKVPCSGNSSRVCECPAGTYCITPAVNSCARCYPHSRCSAGKVVKSPGECPHPQPSCHCFYTCHRIPPPTHHHCGTDKTARSFSPHAVLLCPTCGVSVAHLSCPCPLR